MVKLLIIADDFTGALDTGVKFAKQGAVTKVVAGTGWDFSHMEEGGPDVLVADTETRHIAAEAAYQIVYQLVKKAKNAGVECIFKKTDSGLRGNIGSELAAALEASGEPVLHFIPAFPAMNRITKHGIHYIDGVPVHQSVFGKDPFDPVNSSDVAEIIGRQSSIPVSLHRSDQTPGRFPSIWLYDAESEEDMERIGRELAEKNELRVIAGCAGLAAVLPPLLSLTGREPIKLRLKESILVVCGSINPVTQKQLDYAQKSGFARIRLTPEQKLKEGYPESPEGEREIQNWIEILKKNGRCIIDTNDLSLSEETLVYAQMKQISRETMRDRIAWNLGSFLKRVMECEVDSTIMVTGGDTLMGFMKQIEGSEITPVCELAPGIVLSVFKKDGHSIEIITKSGGFGSETLFADLADQMKGVNGGSYE